VDCSVELIERPEKNLLVLLILAEIHCTYHELSSQPKAAIGRVQDEPAQLGQFLTPMDDGDTTHDVTVC